MITIKQGVDFFATIKPKKIYRNFESEFTVTVINNGASENLPKTLLFTDNYACATFKVYLKQTVVPNGVVFSKGGGSGDGGTIEGIVTEDTNTVNFTGNGKVGSPLKADNIDIYSTTETKTGGTWIDGKPIYRKVFILPESDFLTGGLLELDLSSLNINKVLPNSEASYKYVDTGISKETKFRNIIDSTTFEVWDYFYSDNMLSVIMASNGVKIPHFTEVTFILEYTKTT